jgi:hypothetical protein
MLATSSSHIKEAPCQTSDRHGTPCASLIISPSVLSPTTPPGFSCPSCCHLFTAGEREKGYPDRAAGHYPPWWYNSLPHLLHRPNPGYSWGEFGGRNTDFLIAFSLVGLGGGASPKYARPAAVARPTQFITIRYRRRWKKSRVLGQAPKLGRLIIATVRKPVVGWWTARRLFFVGAPQGRLNAVHSPLRGSKRKNDACGHRFPRARAAWLLSIVPAALWQTFRRLRAKAAARQDREAQATTHERRATSHERRATSHERRATSDEVRIPVSESRFPAVGRRK